MNKLTVIVLSLVLTSCATAMPPAVVNVDDPALQTARILQNNSGVDQTVADYNYQVDNISQRVTKNADGVLVIK